VVRQCVAVTLQRRGRIALQREVGLHPVWMTGA
jgi:hypothetical protein